MKKSLHFYRNNSANKKVLTCSPKRFSTFEMEFRVCLFIFKYSKYTLYISEATQGTSNNGGMISNVYKMNKICKQ